MDVKPIGQQYPSPAMPTQHTGSKSRPAPTPARDAGTEKAKRSPRPKHEDIEMLAYLKYLAAGRSDGSAMDHWLEAERQLSEE